MVDDSFDFAFIERAWTWSHRVGEETVASSTQSFLTLYECIADARKAGFHADAAARRAQAATAMLPGDAGAYTER